MHKHTITKIVQILKEQYPGVKCALIHSSAWQLLVATMLSAQCTDKTVNKVTAILFEKYPDIYAIDEIDLLVLEKLIYSIGFYHNKAKNIKAAARYLLETNQAKVPNSMEQLLKIPGVARKTANVVLSEWFGLDQGIVVDTHVRRISQRLGITVNDNPTLIEKDLQMLVVKEDWGKLSLLMIEHGRQICMAKKPLCEQCALKDYCLYYKKIGSNIQKKVGN